MNKILINIKVYKNRYIKPSRNYLGTIGEKNATVLRFEFFGELNGESVSDFQKRLVAILPEGVLRYDLSGDFRLPTELTASEELTLLVEILKGDDILFKSYPHTFNLIDSGDNPETNLIQAAADSARENCRYELEASLETATGDDHSDKTWDELNGTVAALPVLDEVKQEKIDGFDLVKFSVENAKIGRNGNYSIFTHGLFTTAPVNATGYAQEFTLPYFNTSKAAWEYVAGTTNKRVEYFSPYLKEIGLDCTSAVNFGNRNGQGSIFTNLKKLKLTNVSCTLEAAFMNCTQLKCLEIYGKDGSIKPISMMRTFEACSGLIDVTGDEFDLSELVSTNNMFKGCYSLQHIRFKPFTLKCSIDLGDCRYLNLKPHVYPQVNDFGTIISLLNAIPEPEDNDNSNITITLNAGILESVCTAFVLYDEETRLYSYNSNPDTVQAYCDLYGGFLMKGVTLAWKDL